MTIGIRLKEERLRLGFNQTVMAEKCGVGKNTQLAYEKDERTPDASYLAEAAGLGMDVLYVVTGTRLPLPSESLTLAEADVLHHFRKMTDADRGVVQRMAHALAMSASTSSKQN